MLMKPLMVGGGGETPIVNNCFVLNKTAGNTSTSITLGNAITTSTPFLLVDGNSTLYIFSNMSSASAVSSSSVMQYQFSSRDDMNKAIAAFLIGDYSVFFDKATLYGTPLTYSVSGTTFTISGNVGSSATRPLAFLS